MAKNGVGHKPAEVGRIPMEVGRIWGKVGRIPTQVGRKKIQLISGSPHHLYHDIFPSFQVRIRGAG